jgi:hypothetical protein
MDDAQGHRQAPTQRPRARWSRRRRTFAAAGAVLLLAAAGIAAWGWHNARGPAPSPTAASYAEGTWEEIPAAPLSERSEARVVWAEDRLIVWGGVDPETRFSEEEEYHGDGAVWIPGQGWEEIAPLPEDLDPGGLGFTVWTGSEVVFGAVLDHTFGDVDHAAADGPELVAYDPAEDSWRGIPVTGLDSLADAERFSTVEVGGEVIIAGRHPGSVDADATDMHAVDLQTGQGRVVEPGPYAERRGDVLDDQVHLAASGEGVVGITGGGEETWVLDPDSGAWTRGADPPASARSPFERGLGVGDEVLYLHPQEPFAYDVTADSWRALASGERGAPLTQAGGRHTWTGEVALAVGAVYDPATDTWAEAPHLPLEEDDVIAGGHVAGTGEGLVVFGGLRYTCPHDADCHPDERAPDTLSGWIYRP